MARRGKLRRPLVVYHAVPLRAPQPGASMAKSKVVRIECEVPAASVLAGRTALRVTRARAEAAILAAGGGLYRPDDDEEHSDAHLLRELLSLDVPGTTPAELKGGYANLGLPEAWCDLAVSLRVVDDEHHICVRELAGEHVDLVAGATNQSSGRGSKTGHFINASPGVPALFGLPVTVDPNIAVPSSSVIQAWRWERATDTTSAVRPWGTDPRRDPAVLAVAKVISRGLPRAAGGLRAAALCSLASTAAAYFEAVANRRKNGQFLPVYKFQALLDALEREHHLDPSLVTRLLVRNHPQHIPVLTDDANERLSLKRHPGSLGFLYLRDGKLIPNPDAPGRVTHPRVLRSLQREAF